jgi:hypothetical protein
MALNSSHSETISQLDFFKTVSYNYGKLLILEGHLAWKPNFSEPARQSALKFSDFVTHVALLSFHLCFVFASLVNGALFSRTRSPRIKKPESALLSQL